MNKSGQSLHSSQQTTAMTASLLLHALKAQTPRHLGTENPGSRLDTFAGNMEALCSLSHQPRPLTPVSYHMKGSLGLNQWHMSVYKLWKPHFHQNLLPHILINNWRQTWWLAGEHHHQEQRRQPKGCFKAALSSRSMSSLGGHNWRRPLLEEDS